MISIIGVGDIMPGGVLNGTDRDYLSQDLRNLLTSGDLRVGTLETAIGNEPSFSREKMANGGYVIYCEDDDIKRLVEMDINVVTLANNHFFDLDEDGAIHTIELLDKYGILHCGGGRNIEEASKPAIVTVQGKKIAFLGFCDRRPHTTGFCPVATENKAGVNPMYDDHVISDIKKYKAENDYVVVMPHWGYEHNLYPASHVYKISRKMIEAGADIVIGSHTHCVQPVINYKGKSIAYGLGNFLFPDRIICPPRSTYYPHPRLDLDSLPCTYGFPRVDEVTFKKWKELARTGMLCSFAIEGQSVGQKVYFTRLTSDNIVILDVCPEMISSQIKAIEEDLNRNLYYPKMLIKELFNQLKKRSARTLRKIKSKIKTILA